MSSIAKQVRRTGRQFKKQFVRSSKDVGGAVGDSVRGAVKGVTTGIMSVAGLGLDIAQSPVFKAALGAINPIYGLALTSMEAAKEGKLTWSQAISMAISGYNIQGLNAAEAASKASDIAAAQESIGAASQVDSVYGVPDAVKKAAQAAGAIADGGDSVKILANAYGADFAKSLGLDTRFAGQLDNQFGEGAGAFASNFIDINKAAAGLVAGQDLDTIVQSQVGSNLYGLAGAVGIESIGEVFGEDAGSFLRDRVDLEQFGQDVFKGEDPYKLVANQFGDDIANYFGADDTNMQALGYAGVETVVGLGQGLVAQDALFEGAKEYRDRGGRLPSINGSLDTNGQFSIGDLAGIAGLDVKFPDFDFNTNFDYKSLFDVTGSDIKDILGSGWDIPSLGSIDFDLSNQDFSGVNFGQLGLSLPDLSSPDFASFGNLSSANLDFKGADFRDLGINAEDLSDYNVDFQDLNIGDIPFPNFLLATGLRDKQKKELEEEEENNLIAQQEIDIVDPRNVDLLDIGNTNPLRNPLLG